MEFDNIQLNIEPGKWRLMQLPGVSSSTGLLNISIQDTQDQDIVVYANPASMPTNKSLYVDTNQMTIASGYTDNVNWYFLALSKLFMVPIKGVNFSVNVLETITLTSGQPSEPITLKRRERLLFKLQNPNQDFAVVQLMAFDPDLQISIFCNTDDPSVIPFLTENFMFTKFPVYLHTTRVDHPEWYFVVEAGNGVIEGYIIATSISSVQLTYGVVSFIPYVQPGQKTLCVLPREENKGGIIQYSAQTVNGTKMPRVTARFENMNQPDKVVQNLDYLFANTDNVNWYFFVEFPNSSYIGLGISILVMSTDTTLVEGTSDWPFFTTSITLKKTISNYSLIRFTSPQTFFLFSVQVSMKVSMSVSAGTIQPTLDSQTAISIESPVISTSIDYWVVISGISYIPPAVTINAYGAQTLIPGALPQSVEKLTFFRLKPDPEYGSAIINVIFSRLNQAVIAGYCSGWKNDSWVILSSGFYSSLDTEVVDWWFRLKPQNSISISILTVPTKKITENTWIPLNDLPIQQYRAYNLQTPKVGIIEILNKENNSTTLGSGATGNSYLTVVGTEGRVPGLYGFTAPPSMFIVGISDPEIEFPFWIVVYGNRVPTVDAGFFVVTHEIQTLEINQPKMVTTKNGISILRLDPTEAETNAILQYSIVTPESPTRVYGFSGIPPTIQSKNEIKDNDWKLSSNISVPMFYIAKSTFPNSHFNFTVSSPGDIHLCHTVLLCNGHGRCPTKRLNPHCECIHGIGYGFAGPRCDQTDRPYVWSGIVLLLILFLLMACPTLYVSLKTCRKFSKHLYQPILLNSIEFRSCHTEDNSDQLVVELKNISYIVKDRIRCTKKQILENVSATFVSGEITAIMGPSGSGKSTLLRILGGKMKPSSGKISINGTKSSMSKLRNSIGYVPQEDILPIHVSVEEVLYFSAKLRRNWYDEIINEKVQIVLDSLGLTNQAKQFVTEFGVSGGLSGGQRKRASVGMEMVVDAKLLLMDEPTSGLDSATANDLIQTLSKIAKEKNIAIVVVIHQPRHEIYAEFDNIFLLANGRGAYFGPPLEIEQLKEHLTNSENKNMIQKISNPADLAIDYFNEIDWDQIDTPERSIPDFPEIDMNISLPSRISQMETFSKRAIYQVVRTPFTFYYFCFLVMIASLLVSWAFRDATYQGPVAFELALTCPTFVRAVCLMPQADDFLNFYLMICLALGLTSTTTSLPTFKEEKFIYQRESSSGTSSLAYFLGKNFAEIPSLLVQPLAFMSLFYLVSDAVIPPEKMYLILLGIQFSCMGLGYMAATLVEASQSLILGVVFVFLSIIISGFKPSLKTWKDFGGFLEMIPDISYARWGLEGLYIAELNQYKDIYYIDSSVDYYGYQKDNFAKCVIVLFMLGLLFRVFAYFAIRFVHRK